MANRRDSRYDEQFRENARRTSDWDNRPEYNRDPSGQWSQSDSYSSRGHEADEGGRGWRDPEWDRGRREGFESGGYGSSFRTRHVNQGGVHQSEAFRSRPYNPMISDNAYGSYPDRSDIYHDREDRGFGDTSTGTEWGAGDIGRHRLGSLTDSAAASATRLRGAYREGDRDRGYTNAYPERVSHAGRGPKGYTRSDERIREEVCELLTRNDEVDASDIEVAVKDGTVVLSGTVDSRRAKRVAEDLAQDAWGAKDVQNQIRVENGQSAGRVKPETTGGVQTVEGSSPGSVLGLSNQPAKR